MIRIQAQPFDYRFELARTALVIIDMQRDFVEPGGFGETLGNDVSLLRAIIPACQSVLNAWREAPVFSERERAALAWVEAVTLITEGHVPDAVYEQVRRHFSEKELVDLTAAAVAINGWNRFAIAFRASPQVKGAKAAA